MSNPTQRPGGSRGDRAEAHGKHAGRAGQHPGFRHPKARADECLELRRLRQVIPSLSFQSARRPVVRASTCAASSAAATATTPARSPASACISMSSRSRRSTATSTCISMTSSVSRRCRARKARLWREFGIGHHPHHHQQARSEGARRRLRPGRQHGRSWRPGL